MKKIISFFVFVMLFGIGCSFAGSGGGPTENDVKAFVYSWFAGFDKQADEGFFLSHLDDADMVIEFPERTLKSHKDFIDWYAGIKKDIAYNRHHIKDVLVSFVSPGKYEALIELEWTARKRDGSSVDMPIAQKWEIDTGVGGNMVIRRYIVKAEEGRGHTDRMDEWLKADVGGTCPKCYDTFILPAAGVSQADARLTCPACKFQASNSDFIKEFHREHK
jgi:hypothetical protein